MRISDGQLQLSATDVAKHLACRHVTTLDMLAVLKKIERPYWHDPGVAVLEERGLRHEAAYLQHLKDLGYDVLADDDGCHNGSRIERTVNAMHSGAGAIVQADLKNDRWRGRADAIPSRATAGAQLARDRETARGDSRKQRACRRVVPSEPLTNGDRHPRRLGSQSPLVRGSYSFLPPPSGIGEDE